MGKTAVFELQSKLLGTIIGVNAGDTRSVDYSSFGFQASTP